jgi:hypothetical protein
MSGEAAELGCWRAGGRRSECSGSKLARMPGFAATRRTVFGNIE